MAEPLAWLSHCLRALQVTTLGYDGHLGTEQPLSRLVIALALICGLLFTTMPITVLGGAFAAAWEQKEVVEVAMKVQEFLLKHGRSEKDVKLVFDAFDTDGSRELDWNEFKAALRVLQINLPLVRTRRLFTLFDADDSGTVNHDEFCKLLVRESSAARPSIPRAALYPPRGPLSPVQPSPLRPYIPCSPANRIAATCISHPLRCRRVWLPGNIRL